MLPLAQRTLLWSFPALLRRGALLLAVLLPAAGLAAGAAAQNPGFPQLAGRVVDEAEVLSTETEMKLIDLLASHEAAGGVEVVVVTLSSLQGIDIADFGKRLARYWGVGSAEEGAGVLLILAPGDRAVRIEVGQGLEERLAPAVARAIIEREILPLAASGDYDGAVLLGTRAVLSALSGGYIPRPLAPEEPDDTPLARLVVLAIAAFYLAALSYTLASARRRRRSRAARVGTVPRQALPRRRDGGRRPNAGWETGVDGAETGSGGGAGNAGGSDGGGSSAGADAAAGAGASGGW